MTKGTIVGRADELAIVTASIERCHQDLAALVIEGEAGIGKSTLWEAGLTSARERGLRVLASRPAEAERHLAYAGLGDLFEDVLDLVLPALPPPRRRALEVALLLEDGGHTADPRALGVALREAFEALAEESPVVIAVDDVQWLDGSSASGLVFALRRLADAPILLLLARRVDDINEPAQLEQAVDRKRVDRLHVRPLSLGAIHRLVQGHLARTLSRPTLLRVHETSGGNPFHALEIVRMLGEDVDPTQPLRVPATLEGLVRARIDELQPKTQEALLYAAAVGRPSADTLTDLGFEDALDAALAAHIIEGFEGMIRFTHPLLAWAAYGGAPEGERRRAHRRLALVVTDPLDRARHLALSAEGPDARIAADLESAAALAGDRGVSIAAAELAEHSLRLTPVSAPDDRLRRTLLVARAQRNAGESARARALLADLLANAASHSLRAEALVLLAELETERRSIALLEQALGEASSDAALQSIIHGRLAWANPRSGHEHARRALELAQELDDGTLRSQAQAMQAVLGWFAGDGETPGDLPSRVRDFPRAVGGELLVREATLAVVNTLAPVGKRDEVRTSLEREHREWRDRDEPRSARALWGLAWVEFWAGQWTLAAEYAATARDISIQYGLEMPQDHLPSAVVAVHRGQLQLAQEHAERAIELAEEQFRGGPIQLMAVLGLVSKWNGDAAAAEEWFEKADQRAAELGWREPSIRWWTADHAELLLEAGRTDEAVRIIEEWEADAVRVGREWVLAHAMRCRGLVAASQGDVALAGSLLDRAIRLHEDVGDSFGAARALLAVGAVRRRARKKRAARDAIEAALNGFEDLGAAGWCERARAELGSIGGRKREEGLTPAESRVATLVAEGRTNREVAAALFLAERTVASHLSHVYAKLGVRSRTELARELADSPGEGNFRRSDVSRVPDRGVQSTSVPRHARLLEETT